MAYKKVPEFESNKPISSSAFNKAFSAFEDLNLDGENFADESLGVDQVPQNISLTDTDKIIKGEDSFTTQSIIRGVTEGTNPFRSFEGSGVTYSGQRFKDRNLPNLNRVTLKGVKNGDKFIIRASCVVDVPDGGWRTYFAGVPPVFKIGLVRIPGEEGITNGSSNANTTPIYSTVATYRVAFTGKVPSASSLSREAVAEHSPSGGGSYFHKDITMDAGKYSYRDTRGGADTAEAHDPNTNKSGLPFQGYHSYTTAYLYECEAGHDTTQSFRVMCFFGGADKGHSTPNLKVGKDHGCGDPKFESARIREFKLFCYQVKN
tara:strand:+ start:3752 stop:4705 length:954 start_codon:yes stop_codon:yes gene_type:complete